MLTIQIIFFLTLTFSASFCESIIFLKLFEKIEWLLRNFNWFKVVEIFIFIYSVNNEVLVVFQHTSNLIKSWPSIWIIFPTACNKIAIIVYEIVTSEEIFPTFTNYIQIHNATIYYYGKWINITGNRKFVFQNTFSGRVSKGSFETGNLLICHATFICMHLLW